MESISSSLSSPTTLTTKLFAAATQEPDKRLRTRNDGAARPTNREIFLQMVDAMNDSMHGEVPEAEIIYLLPTLQRQATRTNSHSQCLGLKVSTRLK